MIFLTTFSFVTLLPRLSTTKTVILKRYKKWNTNLISISDQTLTFLLGPLRGSEPLLMVSIKENASHQRAEFLTIDGCPSSHGQPRGVTLKDRTEQSGRSYLHVHRRQRTWLFHCPARECSCGHPERESKGLE